MIVDELTYAIAPGKMAAFLAENGRTALPIMRVHLGEPIAYYVTESGDLGEFVHLWRFESYADREARRLKLHADPKWIAYLSRSNELGFVLRRHSRVLRAIPIPAGAVSASTEGTGRVHMPATRFARR